MDDTARTWFSAQCSQSAVDEAWLCITPNQRLALFLGRDWASCQSQDVWQPMAIKPFTQFVHKLWQDYSLVLAEQQQATPLLLSPAQIHQFWAKLTASPAVDQAIEADQLAREWGLQQEPGFCNDHQLQQKQWQQQYAQAKLSNSWVDFIDVLERLSQIEAVTLLLEQQQLPIKILLYGFVEYGPLQQAFFNSLQQCGVLLRRGFDAPAELSSIKNLPIKTPQLLAWPDLYAELYGAAQWAKTTWQNLSQQMNAQQQRDSALFAGPRVAVIVPNLAQHQAVVKAIFTEVFQWQDDLQSQPLAWTMSAGQALIEYPLLGVLVDCFYLCFDTLELADFEQFLQSPALLNGFLAKRSSHLLPALRSLAQQSWTLAKLITWLESQGLFDETAEANSCHQALTQLQAIAHNLVNGVTRQQTWTQWLDLWLDVIDAFVWPGPALLSSEDFQLLQRWQAWWSAQHNAAQALVMADEQLSYNDAISLLKRDWRTTMFQPEATTDRILVLGLLEACALPLDAALIVGLTAEHWPAASQPNPLLPYEEQRALQIPRSTPVRELWYGQALLRTYATTTGQLVLSYAQSLEDVPQFRSPLIHSVFGDLDLQMPPVVLWRPRVRLEFEQVVDRLAPLAAAGITAQIKGGAYALGQQALCPFIGALELRVAPKPVAEACVMVSGLERGRWLHKVLELVWQTLKTRQGLQHTQQADQLINLVAQCTAQTLAPSLQYPYMTSVMLEVEQARLESLVLAGLALELEREDFIVQGIEQSVQLQVDHCELDLRLDRWDVQGDQWVIIDYKSSLPTTSDERLLAPQLMLYALALLQLHNVAPNQIVQSLSQAVYFTFKPSQGVQWQPMTQGEAVQAWFAQERQQLSVLIDEIRQGHSALQPVNGQKTCNTCDYQSYCRVQRRRGVDVQEQYS